MQTMKRWMSERRTGANLIAGGCLALLLFAGVVDRVHAAEKPNVLFLICDDLNCDLGCYGHAQVQSPAIDALAERGVRFERAYCQYPLCGPTRASFMTSLYPDQTLIHQNAIHLRERLPNVKSMAEFFREHGYYASRIGKIYHYNVPKHIGTGGHDDPFSWDQTFNPRGRDVDDEASIFTLREGQFGGTLSWLAAEGTDEEQTDGIASLEAVRQLKQFAASERPFFLAVGLYRPHTPYVAPKAYFERYPVEDIRVPSVPAGYLQTLPEPAQDTLTRKKDQVNLPEELARQAIQAYYASITFADAQVGRVLEGLREAGLDKNTVVLFTSDHGYHMGEHGHYQKTTLFENATRVPLIISYPGMETAGQTTESFAEMIDFYPTLAELCGLTPPQFISGVSQVPSLQDPAKMTRTSALSQFQSGYSLRTKRFRYTAWGENGADGEELYDQRTDPEELVNLAREERYQQELSQLRQQLGQRVSQATRRPPGIRQRLPGQFVR